MQTNDCKGCIFRQMMQINQDAAQNQKSPGFWGKNKMSQHEGQEKGQKK